MTALESPRKTAEAIEAYILAHYVTLDALAERAGLPPARIEELIAAHCVPPHSHEIRATVTFYSEGFGSFATASAPRRYYHPSLVAWIGRAQAHATEMSLAEVARQVRQDFEADVLRCLDGAPLPWPRGIDHPWAYLMDGTFGLCLKELTVPCLVQKEAARATIAELTATAPAGPPSVGLRRDLEAAIARYDAVTLSFAPHEVEASSRRLEIAPTIERFGLAWPGAGKGSRRAA